MKYIAHRGLFNGPDINLENRPRQVELAILNGYDCEVDLWLIDTQLFLGHDYPDYLIPYEWLLNKPLWIHAKNLEALRFLTNTSLTYFWHETDKFTLTSNNYIWTYPGNTLTDKSIMVMPEMMDNTLAICEGVECYAICSDYVDRLRTINSIADSLGILNV